MANEQCKASECYDKKSQKAPVVLIGSFVWLIEITDRWKNFDFGSVTRRKCGFLNTEPQEPPVVILALDVEESQMPFPSVASTMITNKTRLQCCHNEILTSYLRLSATYTRDDVAPSIQLVFFSLTVSISRKTCTITRMWPYFNKRRLSLTWV